MKTGVPMSLRGRIVAVALAPCLAFAAVAGVAISDRMAQRAEMIQVEDLVGLASRISAFAHEGQRERGASSLFLASKGSQFKAELVAQRARTDAVRQGLAAAVTAAAAYGPAFARKADAFAQALDGLDAQRNAVDALKPTAPQAAAAYTGLIGEGLGMVRALSGAIGPVGIANHAASYAAFLTMKEYAGQERAAASAAFAAGSLDLAGIRRLATLQADQATYEGLFRSRTEPAQGALLDAAEATAPARGVARLRKVALETMPGEALAFRDAPLWFRLATQRIDGLKAVEDHLTADLAAEAGGVRATAERALAIWSGAALAIFLLSGALAFGLGTAVARPLIRMSRALTAIGRGDDDVAIPQGGPIEVRAIAAAAIEFRDNVAERRRSRAAQERMSADAELARRAAALELADGFEDRVGGIVEAVSAAAIQLEAAAHGMTRAAGDASSLSLQVARASHEAALSADTVAAATEQLSASVAEIGTQVTASADLAAAAERDAEGMAGE
ncbi:HAMP domain-containing protein, partial [Methylobacterium sp. WL93]|uniref:nitrate- and nitrite sensing domain-containing protein n=1 Tax=Methylobacterium sp. WL93 TaxID=2603892 RepID=UPI0011CB1E6D